MERRWLIDKLRDEEAKARKNTAGVKGRQYINKLRGQAGDWASSQLDPDFERRDRKRDDPPADVLFVRKSDPSKIAVVLAFVPFTDDSEHDNRYTLFLNALAGFPSIASASSPLFLTTTAIGDWLRRHGVNGGNIDFLRVRYHAEDFEPVKLRRPEA